MNILRLGRTEEKNMSDSSHAKVCVSCQLPYSLYEAGSWLCYWHPGSRLESTQHLACCGMASDAHDCKTHIELHREPKGCHRSDHSATLQEREAYATRPFSICPLSQITEMRSIARADGKKVFHFSDASKMPAFIDIRVPDTWGEGKEATGGVLRVDLKEEQDRLYAALNSGPSVQAATNPYDEEWDRVNGEAAEDGKDFIPFALFLRVDPEPDQERKTQFESILGRPCS